MKNIALFDACSGYLFDRLYRAFPLCIDFAPKEDIEEMEKDPQIKKLIEDSEAAGIFKQGDTETLFSSTVLWLAHNDFIEFATSSPRTDRPHIAMPYDFFGCVQLTQKGLGLMTSHPPKSLKRSARLGEEIVKQVKEGSLKEAGKMITGAIVGYGADRLAGAQR